MRMDPRKEGLETFYEVAWVCTCSHPPGYGLGRSIISYSFFLATPRHRGVNLKTRVRI